MKNLFLSIGLIIILVVHCSAEDRKLAQTGMKFLNISLDARVSALGGSFTAAEGYSTSMFYNTAGMAFMQNSFHTAFGQVSYIADIDYKFGSIAYRPEKGQYGVFGLNFVYVDYGNLKGTIRAENEQGFLDIGTFSPLSFALGLGYSKSLTSQVAIGGNVKYVKQDLIGGFIDFAPDQESEAINTQADVMVFDFGILYKTGFKSLNFGMSVRNFSQEIEYINESFQLPLTFRIGFSVNALDFYQMDTENHSLLVTVDAKHPRDYAEQLGFGAEYGFMKKFYIRAGYEFPNDEHGFSAGAGFLQEISDFVLGIDYAYIPFGVFGSIHGISMHIAM